MKQHILHILKTIPHVILFGLVAAIAGYFIPHTYYQFFDNTQYYIVHNPVMIEEDVTEACGKVDAYINRTSLIDAQGDSVINLSLIREDKDGVSDRVTSLTRRISITKGSGVVITHWNIPCDVAPGDYYFDGVVQYDVRGITKYTPFVSEIFEVKEPNDPS